MCLLSLAESWECHPEVSEMMTLQQQGLSTSARPNADSSGSDSNGEGGASVTVGKEQENKFALLSTNNE